MASCVWDNDWSLEYLACMAGHFQGKQEASAGVGRIFDQFFYCIHVSTLVVVLRVIFIVIEYEARCDHRSYSMNTMKSSLTTFFSLSCMLGYHEYPKGL
jgi:hypothetical protein